MTNTPNPISDAELDALYDDGYRAFDEGRLDDAALHFAEMLRHDRQAATAYMLGLANKYRRDGRPRWRPTARRSHWRGMTTRTTKARSGTPPSPPPRWASGRRHARYGRSTASICPRATAPTARSKAVSACAACA